MLLRQFSPLFRGPLVVPLLHVYFSFESKFMPFHPFPSFRIFSFIFRFSFTSPPSTPQVKRTYALSGGKIVSSADEAVKDIHDGSTLYPHPPSFRSCYDLDTSSLCHSLSPLFFFESYVFSVVGGFGLCGIPEKLIQAVNKKGVKVTAFPLSLSVPLMMVVLIHNPSYLPEPHCGFEQCRG